MISWNTALFLFKKQTNIINNKKMYYAISKCINNLNIIPARMLTDSVIISVCIIYSYTSSSQDEATRAPPQCKALAPSHCKHLKLFRSNFAGWMSPPIRFHTSFRRRGDLTLTSGKFKPCRLIGIIVRMWLFIVTCISKWSFAQATVWGVQDDKGGLRFVRPGHV